ncbi:hypothetical protein PINS_up005337 [Pythium insidiosum]|nr:hypothetical protein PINS_up005337 [Pythium insidiosum]
MSGSTRPIPISQGSVRGGSQRSSPSGTTGGSDSSPEADVPSAMISQSCPVNGNAPPFLRARYQPPHAPIIGSLPEPSFLLNEESAMPELILPPPAHPSESESEREPSVVQFASSCPVDIGYMRQGHPIPQRSWAPSPRATQEFDLSKSPALAVMSAMRERRGSVGSESRQFVREHSYQERRSLTSMSSSLHTFREEDDEGMNFDLDNGMYPQQLRMDRLSISSTPHDRRGTDNVPSLGLPPRRPERRGSYDGGVFHFEDQ